MTDQPSADDTAEAADDTDAQPTDTADAGGRSTGALPDANDLSQQELDEIEAERRQRTAAENRPDGSEVDNTDRDFDPVRGQFTDSDPDESAGPYRHPDEQD